MLLSIENRELSLLFEVGLWSLESSLTGKQGEGSSCAGPESVHAARLGDTCIDDSKK